MLSAQIIIKHKGKSRVKKGKMEEDGGKRLPLGGGLAAPRGAPPPEPPGSLETLNLRRRFSIFDFKKFGMLVFFRVSISNSEVS